MSMTTMADLHRELIEYLEKFPANIQATAEALVNDTFKGVNDQRQ